MKLTQYQPASGLWVTHNKGYVLATSLLLLVVMAMLAVSMYGNVTVQETMAGNMRVKSRTLVAVKSAVQSNWRFDVMRNVMVSPGDTATNTIQVTNEYNDDNVELSGEVRICYLGETQCAGNSTSSCLSCDGEITYMCKAFFSAGQVIEVSTDTSSTIEQAGFILMAQSDELSNCNQAQLAASGMEAGMSDGVAMMMPTINMPAIPETPE